MDGKSESVGLLLGFGKPKAEKEPSPKDEACKAMFDALKEEDYAAFKDALELYLDERDAEYSSDEPEEGDGDDAA